MPEKAERKARRKLEILNHESTAPRKNVLRLVFNLTAPRNEHEIIECVFDDRRAHQLFRPFCRQKFFYFIRQNRFFAVAPAHLCDDGKGREKPFAVMETNENRRRLTGKNSFGKTHFDV